MVSVAVYGPNLRTQSEAIHVHKPGCADTKKAVYRGHQPWVAEVEDYIDLVAAVYDPGDFCYDVNDEDERAPYEGDIKVFPCVVGI